ncbi:MAG: hypothetical protein K8W52_30480 [Deltaproteobacteria bacterium]|nr:hypothetical protein [Deltaproteobacteria bacterium]
MRARSLLGTWRGRFIVAWLAVQLLLPCCYYLTRRDPHDERFAWRMFSPMRMIKCDPRFTVDGARVDLGKRFHEAWIELAGRGRYSVLEAMGARLCKEMPGQRIELELVCKDVAGAQERIGGYDICTVTDL